MTRIDPRFGRQLEVEEVIEMAEQDAPPEPGSTGHEEDQTRHRPMTAAEVVAARLEESNGS